MAPGTACSFVAVFSGGCLPPDIRGPSDDARGFSQHGFSAHFEANVFQITSD